MPFTAGRVVCVSLALLAAIIAGLGCMPADAHALSVRAVDTTITSTQAPTPFTPTSPTAALVNSPPVTPSLTATVTPTVAAGPKDGGDVEPAPLVTPTPRLFDCGFFSKMCWGGGVTCQANSHCDCDKGCVCNKGYYGNGEKDGEGCFKKYPACRDSVCQKLPKESWASYMSTILNGKTSIFCCNKHPDGRTVGDVTLTPFTTEVWCAAPCTQAGDKW